MEATRGSPSMEVVELLNKCQLLQQIFLIIFDPKDMIASECTKHSPIKLDDKFVYALLKLLRCYAYLHGKYKRGLSSMEVVEPSNKCQLLQQIVHIIFDPKDMIASESTKHSPIKPNEICPLVT